MPFLTDGGPQEMVEHSVEEEEQPENRLMADVLADIENESGESAAYNSTYIVPPQQGYHAQNGSPRFLTSRRGRPLRRGPVSPANATDPTFAGPPPHPPHPPPYPPPYPPHHDSTGVSQHTHGLLTSRRGAASAGTSYSITTYTWIINISTGAA